MIRLFLADIDGCLAEPYEAFDLDGFRTLAAWGRRAEEDPLRPRLGICSGRAYAYVEATAQALDLRGPALFESGAGRFDLPEARVRWSPLLTAELEAQLSDVRDWLRREIVRESGLMYDWTKRAQTGVVGLDREAVERAAERVERHVAASFPDLVVAPTHVSVDVLPRALTKRAAIERLADEEGLDLAAVAYIGDTRGDVAALEVVGASFAPANAQAEVKAAVDHVTDGAGLEGVLEAYRWCVRRNHALAPAE
ncbi:MAG: HAD family hydrolase [Rhodothermales bacterium]|nr:HAD family hydrolase [Rhodothermales bacterium]